MNKWLRLTLVTMTVGGGFAGIAITSETLFSTATQGPAVIALCIAFILLYVFVVVSGLIFIENPARTRPLLVALALQIPVISSPVLSFQFAAGLYASAGLGQSGLTMAFRFGCQWQCLLLQAVPWNIGLNFAAVFLLVALIRSSPSGTAVVQQ